MGRILNRAGQRGLQGPAVLTTARRPHAAAGVSNGVAIRKVVAVGGSAGGIQSLCKVIEGLAPEFAAPLLAVIHMGECGSYLAKVLERCGNIKVLEPETAEPIAAGRVYLPFSNQHLS